MAKEWMSLTLEDDFGRLTHIRREMQAHALLVEYQVEIDNFVAAFALVSDLAVVRADFVQTGLNSTQAVTAGANVDVGATFSGWIEGVDGKKASTKIPGFKAALVNGDGTIDIEETNVAAFLAQYADAGDFMISDGENVTDWIRGSLDR